MGLFSFLLRRTPAEVEKAPPIIASAHTGRDSTVVIGLADDAAPKPEEKPRRRYLLEPFFMMIEYTDSTGQLSRRRITMRSIEERGEIRYLQAICHERNAFRMFRLDRINCLITQDGEVEDPAPWFEDIISSADYEDLGTIKRRHHGDPAKRMPAISPYTALKRAIAPGMAILVAAARSDDFLHPREVDCILRFAEDEALKLRKDGLIARAPEAEAFEKLERTLRRMRPTREDVANAITALSDWDIERQLRLVRAVVQTASADGQTDDIEAQLIEELREMGGRKHGFGWDED